MNKRTMIILSIVISILSVTYLALCYFGLVRYLKLHVYSIDNYVSPYIELPRGEGAKKIAINITATDRDLSKLKPFINSILDQTIHVDQIAINLPSGTYAIPDYLEKCNIITFYKLSGDYGAASKYIGPLLREKDGTSIIICLDEDVIYGPDFIETLLDENKKNPECVIFTKGYNAKKYIETGKFVDENSDIIDFSGGVLFKPSQISPDIIEVSKGPENIYKMDDIWFSAMIKSDTCKIKYDENMKRHGYKKKENKELRERAINYFAAYLPSMS